MTNIEKHLERITAEANDAVKKVASESDVFKTVSHSANDFGLYDVLAADNLVGSVEDGSGGFLKQPKDLKETVVFRYGTKGNAKKEIILKAIVKTIPREIETYRNGRFPQDRKKVFVEGAGKGKSKIEVKLEPRDFFAIEPSPSNALGWRIYTPYTGRHFFFHLIDDKNVRTFDIDGEIRRKEANVSQNPFAYIMAHSEQAGISIGGGKSILNKAFTFWDARHEQILESQERFDREIQRKKANFRFRVGDVIRDFREIPDAYLITHKIYNPNTNQIRWVMMPFERVGAEDPTDYVRIVDTPSGFNPLREEGAKFVREYDEASVKNIRRDIWSEVRTLLKVMGLSESNEAGYSPRDDKQEIPPRDNDREQKTEIPASDVTKGYMVYLDNLPKVPTVIKSDANRGQSRGGVQFDDNGYALRTFPGSGGWYIIIDKKDVQGSQDIFWALVPAKGDKVVVNEPKYGQVGGGGRGVSITAPEEQWNYVTLKLPPSGDRALLSPQRYDPEKSRVRYVGNEQRFKNAEIMYKKYDPKGRDKQIKDGDIIAYGDDNYIVGNRKPKGDKVTWLLIPLRSITDPVNPKSSTAPADETAGYTTDLVKDKEGRGSLEEEAVRYYTREEARKLGLVRKAFNYYKEYNSDGTPRAQPLNPADISGFGAPAKSDNKDIGLGNIFTTNDFNEGKESDKGAQPRSGFGNEQQKTSPIDRIDKNYQDNDEYSDALLDEEGNSPQQRLVKDIRSKKLNEGTVITYSWGAAEPNTNEIFLEHIPENGMIRLVPHADFQGPDSGLVDDSGYIGITKDNRAIRSSFESNYDAQAYDDSGLPSRLRFTFSGDIKTRVRELMGKGNDRGVAGSPGKAGPTGSETREKSEEELEKEKIREDSRKVKSKFTLSPGKVIQYQAPDGQLDEGVIWDTDLTARDPLEWYITLFPTGNAPERTISPDQVNDVLEPSIMANEEIVDDQELNMLAQNNNYVKAMRAFLNAEGYQRILAEELDERLEDFYKSAFDINISLQ